MSSTTNKTYGYARVSTREQHEDRQVLALVECGIAEKDIFVDKQSGKNFDRPLYRKLIKKLKPCDTIFVKSIDRLGRNYEEIIEQWRVITKETGASIVVIDMPLLDTRQKGKDLISVFISDLVLQILSYVAETERDFIRQRQKEGIAIAKAKGVRFGRAPKEKPDIFPELCEAWKRKKISARAAGKKLGVTHRTFGLWAVEYFTPTNG